MNSGDYPAGCKNRRFGRALQDLFEGRVPPPLPMSLSDHLKSCPACRTQARTLASADRLLGEECGAPVCVSPFEIDLAWQAVAARLNIAERQSRRWFVPSSILRGRRLLRLLPAAIGLALVLVVGAAFIATHKTSGFAARGAAAPPDLRLVCIPAGDKSAPRSARAGDGPASCSIDETLGFAYLNPEGRFGGLLLYAVDSKDNILWYAPNPAQPAGISIEPAARPRALPRTVRLAVNHHPGRYTLVAAFTRRPLDLAGLDKLAVDLARGRRHLPGAQVIRRDLIIAGEGKP
ncbi:MAG TPA: hypothetical protein VM425_08810 [Myxococcota bacterium]|nr:hypothetical protein [Myxococcota bacterium]